MTSSQPSTTTATTPPVPTLPTPTFQLSTRLTGLSSPTVWHEFSPLSTLHSSVNLGQGFPDWNPPQFCIDAMATSTDPTSNRNANQYARSSAHMPLANVLAKEYGERFGRVIDPVTEVATAVGCTNAMYCVMMGLISPGVGDEVVLLEPAFDIYAAQVKMAGGVVTYVPLRATEAVGGDGSSSSSSSRTANEVFRLDFDELEAAITSKTRVLLLNTPHNPTGKMFDREEMDKIAEIVMRHPQVTVISDEVYEHIVFDEVNSPHISIATLPGMWDRTLTLSSSGKTFSATGWKVGWSIGPPHLTQACTSVQQWVNFSAPTPNQDAIAQSLLSARQPYQTHPTYYAYIASEYKRKRRLLCDALRTAGMEPIIPNGGFFIMADTKGLEYPKEFGEVVTEAMPVTPMPRDWALSRWMTEVVGVTAIPPCAFYKVENVGLAKNLLRFAYCKGDDTILEAHERFRRYYTPDAAAAVVVKRNGDNGRDDEEDIEMEENARKKARE